MENEAMEKLEQGTTNWAGEKKIAKKTEQGEKFKNVVSWGKIDYEKAYLELGRRKKRSFKKNLSWNKNGIGDKIEPWKKGAGTL